MDGYNTRRAQYERQCKRLRRWLSACGDYDDKFFSWYIPRMANNRKKCSNPVCCGNHRRIGKRRIDECRHAGRTRRVEAALREVE